MKITNKRNLPEAFVKAVTPQKPTDGHTIRVTQLIEAPRIRRLEIDHWDELETDVEDNLWALFGTGLHKALADNNEDISENKLTAQTLASFSRSLS